MSSILTVTSGSLTLSGAIFASFLTVEKYSSKEFKYAITKCIKEPFLKPDFKIITHLNTSIDKLFPKHGFSLQSVFNNSLIILLLFLVFLTFLNTNQILFGEAGILIDETGAITTNVSSEKVNLKLQEISNHWVEYFNNYSLVGYVVLPLIIFIFSLFIPGYISLLFTLYIFRIIRSNISFFTAASAFVIDTAVKSAFVIIYSVMILSTLTLAIDEQAFSSSFSYYLAYYIDAITFTHDNTVVPSLFYSILYINGWYVVFFLSVAISKMLYITAIGKKLLNLLNVDNHPICCLGIVASFVTFVSCQTDLISFAK